MPRIPTFDPIETASGWMVSIPISMTATGQRRRKYFPSKTAAEKFAQGLRRQHQDGVRGSLIPVALANQAAQAARILEGTGISIVDAARLAAAKVSNESSREKLKDRLKRATASGEAHWSDRYKTDIARIPRWAPSLMDLPCGAIDREKIEDALQEDRPLKRSTIDMRTARILAIIGFRERHRKSAVIHILTKDQQEAVLAACQSPQERRTVALLLYAGIRPDAESGEISRLEWDSVRKSEIYVPQHASKTGSDRLIPITPRLATELQDHPSEGPVAPAGWRRAWQRIRKDAGISHLQDVLRHTFASHFLAAYGEEAAKAAMGHTAGSTTLFRHYRRAVTEEAGKAFFGIEDPAKVRRSDRRSARTKTPSSQPAASPER